MPFLYRLINNQNNVIRKEAELDQDVSNPWEDKYPLGQVFRIEKIDTTQQRALAEQKKAAQEAAKSALANAKDILTAAKALNNSPEKQVIRALAKAVLQLSKAVGAADALESEE